MLRILIIWIVAQKMGINKASLFAILLNETFGVFFKQHSVSKNQFWSTILNDIENKNSQFGFCWFCCWSNFFGQNCPFLRILGQKLIFWHSVQCIRSSMQWWKSSTSPIRRRVCIMMMWALGQSFPSFLASLSTTATKIFVVELFFVTPNLW